MTDAEQIAQWRRRIDHAIEANALVARDDPDWMAVGELETIARAACDLAEQLADLLRERGERDGTSPPP